jgi:hypothetical protein
VATLFESGKFFRNFQFCSKMANLFENFNYVRKWLFDRKLLFCSKMANLFENANFVRKFLFSSKMAVMFENGYYVRKWLFCSKMTFIRFFDRPFSLENSNFRQTSRFASCIRARFVQKSLIYSNVQFRLNKVMI